MNAKPTLAVQLALALSLIGGVACSDGGGMEPGPPVTPVEVPAPRSLAIDSVTACTADADCESGRGCFQQYCVQECLETTECGDGEACSPHGRCVVGDQPAAADATVALGVREAPVTSFIAEAGQETVTLHIELDGAVPSAGIAYRVERTDDPQAGSVLDRATGTTSIDIPILVGVADPALGADTLGVEATVFTSVGRFDVRIRPKQSVAGAYAGTLALSNLGTVPVEFQIVTEPPGAGLDNANSAWLVLPVSGGAFLSPQDDAGEPTELAAALEYNASSGLSVARFNHAFELGGDGSVFPSATGTVGRGMRFELETTVNGDLVGNFVDVWSGLYDVIGLGGAPEPEDTNRIGTFDMRRVARAELSATDAMNLPDGREPATVGVIEAPLTACTDAVASATGSAAETACAGAGADWATRFAELGAPERAACAGAYTDAALVSGSTIADVLASYTSETPPTGDSFRAFLDDCAAGTDGTCVPAAEVLCARQLAAHAYAGLDADPATAGAVLTNYLNATKEATLGPQLAAFWNDYNARLDWLTVDGAPSVIASALTADSLGRLDAWTEDVLDRHVETLAVHLDASARTVFARVPADPTLLSARTQMLILAGQSWRGATDAVIYATRRWNTLLQDAPGRADKSDYARTQTRELYLASSVIAGFAQSGGGLATAPFRGAFASLVNRIAELELPFEQLVFARDSEVVVSTSLDPLSSTASVLAERADAANDAIATATDLIDGVITGVVADSLTELSFTSGLQQELLATQNEIVELCGLPLGCTVAQVGTTPACAPQVLDGKCGFVVDQSDGSLSFEESTNRSRAGAQVLGVQEAAGAYRIATAARDAHRNIVDYSQDNLAAFAEDVIDWNDTRLAGISEMADIFADQSDVQDEALQTRVANLANIAAMRQASIEGDAASIQTWDRLSRSAEARSFAELQAANDLAAVSSGLQVAAGAVEFTASEVLGASTPFQIGGAIAAGATSLALNVAAVIVDHEVGRRELAADRIAAFSELELETLMAEADVGSAIGDADIAALQEAIQTAANLSANQVAELNRALTLSQEQRAAELAFGRDLTELNDRRFEHFSLVQRSPQYDLEVSQAVLGIQQAILEYHLTAQSAQLAESRSSLLQAQLTDATLLLGSPAVVFSRVNRLDRAELYLLEAKDRMMDWLTALEYLAVRPFVDHRMRILLARNILQLEKIALSMEAIQTTCGGNTSESTLDVSLRDDLLGLGRAITDIDGTVIEPAQRFQALLERGSVPIDRRVRYSADRSVGAVLSSQGGVLAGSFDISLEDFGNLALACNAKLISFEVQLVGDIGDGAPTVSLLYDGTSHVRSCQPDINEYVASFGPGATNFGARTLFHSSGRSASPVAGINEFLSDSANVTLDGLPLASTYTLLIDKEGGSNGSIDWSQLEDVVLRVRYGYQDVFPAGQCQE